MCKSSKNKVIFEEFGIDILQCVNCGHVFSTYERRQDYEGYFGSGIINATDDFFWADEAHRLMYDDFCRRFIVGTKEGRRLLDVGCGLGFFVKRISNFPKWDVFGYEISPAAVDFAKNKLGLKNIFCGKVEDSNFKKQSFDIITLWDVIEHIPDSSPLLSYLHSILKNDGILFMHTPNVKVMLPMAKLTKLLFGMKRNLHYLEAKDHMNLYSVKTIRMLLQNSGFNKVAFIHLSPIQSVAGSKSKYLRFIKNLYVVFSRLLWTMTFGRINMDNLFVVAGK